jgi:quercetin dioxygenase-like cupin family protein
MKSLGKSKEFLFGDKINWEKAGVGVHRKIMGYDDNIMLVHVAFDKGGVGPMHKHVHSQVTYVQKGKFEVTIGDKTTILKKGDGFYIPPNVLHGAICLEDGELLDVFSPIREDFIE